jgi:hypothetical protein
LSVPFGAFHDLHQIGELLATEHNMRIKVIPPLLFPQLRHAIDIGFDDGEADRFFKKRILVGIGIEFGVGIVFLDIRILRIPRPLGR